MSKFKVGDIVVYAHQLYATVSLKLGTHFKVTSVTPKGNVRIEPLVAGKPVPSMYYAPEQFELVEPNPILTPEEVLKHLRKGTKLQCSHKSETYWCNHSGDITSTQVADLLTYDWRIKPEPEIIELNGKKYREIVE